MFNYTDREGVLAVERGGGGYYIVQHVPSVNGMRCDEELVRCRRGNGRVYLHSKRQNQTLACPSPPTLVYRT